MMGHKEKINTGAEHDVISKYWRSMYCYTQRSGVCKSVKAQMSRRIRRTGKNLIRSGDYND